MKFTEYQKKVSHSAAKLATKELDNIHMVLGISTEAGELLDVFKKNIAYNKDIDWTNVKEELGDLCWYIANFCTINNLDFEDILFRNIEKLKVRYPEMFTEDNANNRNLKNEREVLE